MEEQQQQQPSLAAGYPAPPPFWQSFTPENLERISSLRAAQQSSSSSDSANALPIRILDLPPELRHLQPPEPPTEGAYRVFGDPFFVVDTLPSLEESGIQRLYTPPDTPTGSGKHGDRAFILKRIAKSLLLNFLELVGILSINPEHAEEKKEDLRVLFINFHHLLNEYRPHQARESLILMMQDQLDKSRAETLGIKAMKEKVEGILVGLGQMQVVEKEEDTIMGEDIAVNQEVQEGKDVWDELEREFG